MSTDTKETPDRPLTREEIRRQRAINIAEKIFDQQNKLFLRHSLLIPEVERILRWGGINVALNDPEFSAAIRDEEFQQTYSRAAVITGLTRQDVAKSAKHDKPPVDLDGGSLHRLIRVLTAWRTDPGYQDENGVPLDLPLTGGDPSLHQLRLKYGRDTTTRAIADAVVESGNAEWIGESEGRHRGKMLRYVHPVVTAPDDSAEDAAILTQIASDFMHSFQSTFNPDITPRPRFREGYFNDISADKAEEATAELYKKIQAFNVECTELLKKYRAVEGEPTVRLGVGSYSFRDAPLFLDRKQDKSS